MKIRRIVQIGALVQLARAGLARRNRAVLHRKRRNRTLGVLALAAGAAAAWYAVDYLRAEPSLETEWPSKKKLRKEARRSEAAHRAGQSPVKPPVIHVEKEASPDLKVPLGDLTR